MFAPRFHLPPWLLGAIVLCIVLGHFQQVECRLTGCHAAAVEAGDKGEAGQGDCHCHFSVAACEPALPFAVVRFARPLQVVERSFRAPEVPGAEIEYPPRSLCA